jgi:hypothetical protein
MQDNPTAGDESYTDNLVLGRLYEAGPLSEAEIERQYGLDGADSLARLTEMGLAHRFGDGFVIASAAGRHAHEIDPSWR